MQLKKKLRKYKTLCKSSSILYCKLFEFTGNFTGNDGENKW